MRTLFVLLFASTTWAQPKLNANAATGKQVDLAWTGVTGPAAIERRIAGGKYEPLTTVRDGSVYNDAHIDAMAIYQYRVHADTPGSAASNEVTVGPPATGYTVALAPPKTFVDKEATVSFAHSTAMELDSNGDPAFLYSVIDPKFNGGKEAELWFLHWDRAHWKWKAPVKVADFMNYRDGTALARDPQSSTWATVSESDEKAELLVSTDDGATWTRRHSLSQPDTLIIGRAVGLYGGKVFWLHGVGSDGYFLLSGGLTEDPASWKREQLPMPESYSLGSTSDNISLAVDSQGRPGMTYFGAGPDYNVTALYWRPGMTAPRKIQDSDGVQNDFHSAEITYSGAPKDQAKFLVELNRRKDGNVDPEMWVVRDTGSQMAISPKIPTDGGEHSLNAPVGLSFDANGQGAALLGRNGGNGTDKCGTPKLARGGPTGAWKTCSPDARRDIEAGALLYGLSLRHAVNNKLYGGFATSSGPIGPGIILWREP